MVKPLSLFSILIYVKLLTCTRLVYEKLASRYNCGNKWLQENHFVFGK